MAPASAPSMNSLSRRPAAFSLSIMAGSSNTFATQQRREGMDLAGLPRFGNLLLDRRAACRGERRHGGQYHTIAEVDGARPKQVLGFLPDLVQDGKGRQFRQIGIVTPIEIGRPDT